MISATPANAHKAAGIIVSGSATFEASVAMIMTTRAMVTGKGTTLLVLETRVVVGVVVPLVVVLVLVEAVMQEVPVESATSGAVQLATHMLFASSGKDEGQGRVHSVLPLL